MAGLTVDDDDLVQVVFDGLPPSWETFLSNINAREHQPDFEQPWHNCLQEESRMQNKSNIPKEAQVALVSKFKRGKKPFIQKKQKGKSGYKGKSFDVSRVKCFNCQKFGHFAKDYWTKKKRDFKGTQYASTAAEGEEENLRKNSKGSPRS